MNVEIPMGKIDVDLKPAWIPVQRVDGSRSKPIIRCQCGVIIGLGLHHVHADGTVTASFFHATANQLQKDEIGYFFMHQEKKYHTVPGCGWHVFLKLQGYNLGDFTPEKL